MMVKNPEGAGESMWSQNLAYDKKRGFSIIEVMIAAVLLASLGIALATSLDSTIEDKFIVEDISTRYHLARQAMERMANEISMAYLSEHKGPTPVVASRFKGEKDKISFISFGHVAHVRNAKESDQQEISYFIGKDERTNEMALQRKVHINVTSKPGEMGSTDTLCPYIKSLQFKYWDDRIDGWTDSWQTEGVDPKRKLPIRVQIEMVMFVDKEKVEKFMTQTEIWLADKAIMILR